MGNLRSVEKGFAKVGVTAGVTSDPDKVRRARGVVLPGVGAFANAMANLREAGLEEAMKEVVSAGRPFLGICLGLQLLFSSSEENGLHRGLNLIPGKVKRLPPGLKVPHMGWNELEIVKESPILRNIPGGAAVYFVHSYYVVPEKEEVVFARAEYGIPVPAVVGKDNIFGIQFHPEKSSELGLRILYNFGELVSCS